MPLRVLLINQYYPPDTSATAVILADLMQAFVDAGHEAQVLCGRPSYDPTERFRWKPLTRGSVGRVRVERVGSTAYSRDRMHLRIANYLTFLLLGSLRAITLRADVVVVATDPPLAAVVAMIAAKGKPIVYSVRDLHPDAAIAAGWMQPGLLTRAWDRLHAMLMRRMALIVCLGETMRDRIAAKNVPRDWIAVVEDGAWLPERVEPSDEIVRRLRADSDFIVMHAGNLGAAFNWEVLLEAARQFGSQRLLFVGGGAEADRLRKLGARVHPYFPEHDLHSVMAAGDLQVVALRPRMAGLIVPSKLYTALAHGRPILAVVPSGSETARIVSEWNCGVVVDPGDPSAIAREVNSLIEAPDVLPGMSKRAMEASRAYSRSLLLQRFVSLTERAADSASC